MPTPIRNTPTEQSDDLDGIAAIADIASQRRAKITGARQSFLEWALKVPEPKAGKLDFDRYPFQRELYSQEAALMEEAAVKKATQVGVSTWLLRWVLYLCDTAGLNSLYLFPKRKQMYDFSDARVATAIALSPYLKGRIPASSINNKGLKRIGTGWLYARGSESSDDLQSVDADGLAMDEYDDLRQENVPDAERRVSGSNEPRTRRVGVPTLPNYGIDAIYKATDQRDWVVPCPRCGLRQPLTYEDNVDEGKIDFDNAVVHEAPRVVCRGWKEDRDAEGLTCREPLDVLQGEWVAKYPDRGIRGYNMPRLIVAHTNLVKIVTARQKTDPTEMTTHRNKDLAEAYAPAEGRLTDDAIAAATRDDLPAEADAPYEPGRLITMGIDVASVRGLHIRISEHVSDTLKLPLFVGEVEGFVQAERLFVRYGVNMACVDHLPDGRLGMALADRHPGRVYLANFAELKSGVLDVKPEIRRVSVRRTELIDATLDRIRMQRTLLPSEATRPKDYKEHLQAVHRVTGLDDKLRKFAKYDATGDFDFVMAECYDQLAAIVWKWHRETEDAIEGEEVPFGEMYEWEPEHLDAGTADRGDIAAYDPGFG